MNGIIIREVKEKDLKSIAKIKVNGWKSAYKGIVDDEVLDTLNVEDEYKKRLNDYQENGFIVAEYNNEVVGFCRYTLENLFSKEFKEIDGEISALYVKPDLKRNGIGKLLFEYAKSEFIKHGNKRIILWCFKENYPSRAFYEKMGGILYGENTIEKCGKKYKEVGYKYEF